MRPSTGAGPGDRKVLTRTVVLPDRLVVDGAVVLAVSPPRYSSERNSLSTSRCQVPPTVSTAFSCRSGTVSSAL